MKIFVLSSRFPYPTERGDKLRLYHQIKKLSQSNEIHLYALSDVKVSKEDYDEVQQYCKAITVHRINIFTRIKSILLSTGKKLPFLVSSNYVKRFHYKILRDTKSLTPDLLYCQLIRMAPYIVNNNTPAIIDYMDAYGVGMERRATISSILAKPLYNLEAKRTKSYEKSIYKVFKGHCIISQQDADLLEVGKVEIIPNGIDFDYFKPIKKSKKFDLGFIGNMGYLPNVDAAMNLINDILPTYQRLYEQDLSVLLAGARPHNKVKNLAGQHVDVSGWVDDIREAYSSCKILVAPLYNGTGQQNKILEAMAMGTPCITTSEVNAAIGAKPEQHILIANNQGEFAKAIYRLLDDPQLYDSISKESRAFIIKEYSWDNSINKLNTIFAE